METVIKKSAVISECGRYRYRLGRTWDETRRPVCFVMVNPSKADAERDDPTIKRCIGFAQLWGFGSLEVVNLFALRSTDVKELKRLASAGGDVIGPLNDQAITEAAAFAGMVVCAWGAKSKIPKRHIGRAWHVTRNVLKGIPLHCLGRTQCGSPNHPLMLRGDTVPVPYGA